MDQRKSLGSSRAQWGSMEVSGTQCGSVRLAGGPWDRDFRHEKVNVDVAILIRIVGYIFSKILFFSFVRCKAYDVR